MFESRIKTQTVIGGKEIRLSDPANEEDELRSSSGTLSWGFDQRALPELKYTLTVNGYLILP